ncbi:MAG: CBS domain-containing protein [Sulfolobus sp.]|nr:CBS domain-containing protein [Sulfolobus sp.]
MNLRRLAINNPPILNENEEMRLALKKINEKGIGRILLINNNNELTGIISTRDILEHLAKSYESSGNFSAFLNTKLSNLMSKNLIFVYENEDLMDALSLMVIRNIGSLPIVNQYKRPIGIITERSLLFLYNDLREEIKVSLFSSRKVQTIKKETLILDAIKMMIKRGFRRLPVENEENKVIGIITAVDIIKAIAKLSSSDKLDRILEMKAKDLMKTQIETINFDDYLNTAARKLLEKNIGSLLILNEQGFVEGIITERDLLFGLYHLLIYQKYLKQLATKPT